MPAVYGDLAVEPCQGQSIRLSRRFNRPTGLGPTSRIELVIKNPVAAGVVYINDLMVCESLKIDATTRVDVSRELLARNTLVIVLETPSVSNSDSWNDLSASNFKQIIEDVRLEIDDGPSLQK